MSSSLIGSGAITLKLLSIILKIKNSQQVHGLMYNDKASNVLTMVEIGGNGSSRHFDYVARKSSTYIASSSSLATLLFRPIIGASAIVPCKMIHEHEHHKNVIKERKLNEGKTPNES